MQASSIYSTPVSYILRVVGLSEGDEEEWARTLDFADAGAFDAVMCFNATGEMPPHPPLGTIRERVPFLARRMADIRARGMSPMLNYFVTLGHGEAKPAAGMDRFQPIVDGLGREPMGCYCPLDESFAAYLAEAFQLHALAGADSLWIDDDFRLYGRDGAETMQCFCPLHIGAFAEQHGETWTREALYERLLRMDAPDRELRARWFRLQGDSLAGLAAKLRDAVAAADPAAGMGLMVVPPFMNGLGGRRLDAEIDALRTPALPDPWVRTGGGFYHDERPLDLLDKIVNAVDPLPAMIGVPARLCGEIENYPFPVGYKSATMLRMEMYLNVVSASGHLTFSIHDFYLGNHDPSGNVLPMLRETKPYLRAVAAAMVGKVRRGASFPYHPRLAEVRALTPEGYASRWNVNLARLGIPQSPSDASPPLLIGTTANLYSDTEAEALLARGAMLDAEAYWILRERGLLTECPITVERRQPGGKIQTERVVCKRAPDWLKGKNLAVRWHVSYLDGYSLEATAGAEDLSLLLDAEGDRLSAGVVVTDRPYRLAVFLHAGEPMRELGRQWLVQEALCRVAEGKLPPMVEGTLNHYPVWWEGGGEAVLGLCNFGLEAFARMTLRLPEGRPIVSVQRLARDGEWTDADYGASPHVSGSGLSLIMHGDSVPRPLSFETFRIRYAADR
ncbi:hypothetical protein SAMN05216312_10714 [Cohnella sp. OV330]|uniref:hypothetical protein n=1 Tax=Cohnella sp. OV330 TaxID=1855288 RepID=UPI0008F25738|nr:hypothetical protein [Cohnella sp. OV330]SFB39125.1 hypothetical protein SAMN05216312_10714 [Cohnella sp. OV330]